MFVIFYVVFEFFSYNRLPVLTLVCFRCFEMDNSRYDGRIYDSGRQDVKRMVRDKQLERSKRLSEAHRSARASLDRYEEECRNARNGLSNTHELRKVMVQR